MAEPITNYVIHTEEELKTNPEYEGLPTGTVVHGDETIKFSELGVDEDGLSARLLSLSEYFFGNLHHTHHVFYNTVNTLSKQGKKTENRTFIDLKVIRAKSGRGGNGCVSFFRDANRPVGPPDGGDGGDGGDVFISVVNRNMSSLHKIKRTYEAKNGTPGKGSQLDGAVGEDVIIEVPVGTTIRWIPDPMVLKKYLYRREGQQLDDIKLELKCDDKNQIQLHRSGYEPGEGWSFKENDEEYYRSREFFTDLNKRVTEHDHELVVEEFRQDKFPLVGIDFDKPTKRPIPLLRGGRGGMGNMHFLTKDIRNPRFSKRGREGITSFFLLELKLIADLGLVGLPNAGKSTLLRAISRARPRVGHWEFTTLQPTVGTIFTSIDKDPFTVADIPGIIKGASQNKGMGLDFLRHIERSGGLVFVVSLEKPNPVEDLKVLLEEVGEKRMRDKKVLVVATKADLSETGAEYGLLKQFVESEEGWKIVPVCAERGENIERCIRLMGEIAYQ
ncbi:mitochondrial GTPase 2 [Suhomyces tanzawaensis NRRL Y-17324]|uniref:Mitochondrial GTPase 2 n=1 Tax=Suhomyces tanzawaensis NRRL Y-17324 TaxID=984487 RepID=A0A1E4SKQ6_9ASCO|nr:mitochondrial GTPase 2 [Suhomyces tanzawaensis NRRL Y-17324]ODV80089.1 mitochondrial GTPase 2 [Suhomyces tanzawaensis NRRL Y-17324]